MQSTGRYILHRLSLKMKSINISSFEQLFYVNIPENMYIYRFGDTSKIYCRKSYEVSEGISQKMITK